MSELPAPIKKQYLFVDFLKAFAAQVIIFHHLSSYGDISIAAHEIFPSIIDWLFDYGRYAVQIFLVVAGYLAAHSLPKSLERLNLSKVILNRYLRLVPVYLIAILISIACASIARFWIQDEFVGAPVVLKQFLAHIFLLQSLLGIESISAGVWYVAIDFQLFAFLAIILTLTKSKKVIWILGFCILVSALYFTQNDLYEDIFIYFIGSYGLGVLAYYAGDIRAKSMANFSRVMFGLIVLGIVLGSLIQFWPRNYLAMSIAFSLIFLGKVTYSPSNSFVSRLLSWASGVSYSAFLIHFSMILLANAIYSALNIKNPQMAIVFFMAVWMSALIAGHFLHHWIEKPSSRFLFKK